MTVSQPVVVWGAGAILFATALADASIAEVLDAPGHRPTLTGLAREVMAVARAKDIRPEAFDGFDPAAFAPDAPRSAAEESLTPDGSARRRGGTRLPLATPDDLAAEARVAPGRVGSRSSCWAGCTGRLQDRR